MHFTVVEKKLHVVQRRDVGQIALVELKDVRDAGQVEVEALEVLFQVGKAFNIFLHLLILRIGYEDDAVHSAQDQLPGRVVDDLARDGVELELGLEAFDGHRLNREEVEEERAVGTGGEGNEFALVALRSLHVVVHLDQIGRLASQGRAVIDDLDLEFFGCLIDYRHNSSVLFGVSAQFSRDESQLRQG